MPSDKIEKKRKRASDRHERPTKKPALQTLPTLVASVVEDKSELAPIIGMRNVVASFSCFHSPLLTDWNSLLDSYDTRCPQLQGPAIQPIHQVPSQCRADSDPEPGHHWFRDAATVL